ncbi:Hmd co-occurring protein HcgC [Methanobrevibacter sp. 87.7]|uniref:SAM-dependent methyltransferase HcgC family protein n=1 Tax=Methanobrevibacter sp. 87.7 TaxID=387957 RepID=UPI000B509538|nr:SAM-dependent methyltransferase HcgC family protein [Methanobrevibacter sp. 87.7]OWT33364.1 Hmd co-occurring protein HcgC [Methanobrevibacter sp. 87.7]
MTNPIENKLDYHTGISNEVLTIVSKTKVIDIINYITKIKTENVLKWIKSLKENNEINSDDTLIIVGTYFTGLGIVKTLKKEFKKIILIDIYPHLEELLYTPVGGDKIEKDTIEFSSNLSDINKGDIIIDTTGFGGLNKEQSSKINCKAFLIEDPTAEDNDILLKNKNNIHERLDLVNANKKAYIKTKGLDTKTSGTMTFTIKILNKSIDDALNEDGVLYSAAEMTFYEDIIFKEKDINKFIKLSTRNAIKVSSIKLLNVDKIIENNLDKLESAIISIN